MAQRGTTAHIDMVELEKLAMMQCTDEEIAAWFGVTTRTIERRRKAKVFQEAMERGKAKGRVSMRRMQLRLLEQGNATMGVWLGKQYLGQTDEVTHHVQGNVENSMFVIAPRISVNIAGSKDLPRIEDGKTIEGQVILDDESED